MRLALPSMILALAAPALAAPHVEASGSATVRAAPDRAVVRVGVEARAADAASAQARAATQLQAILAALKSQGVPRERISTDRIDLFPYWEPDRQGGQHLAGYRAATMLRVVVPLARGKAENDLGKLVDAAVKAGANQLEGISFEVADDAPLRERAVKEAAQDARSRAQAIASALGVKLGTLLAASDGGAQVGPPPRPYMMAMEKAGAPGTEVLPGAVEVTATAQVRYAVAP